jgi:hypothetical protein
LEHCALIKKNSKFADDVFTPNGQDSVVPLPRPVFAFRLLDYIVGRPIP